jgi:WD40 repeat protein
MCRIVNSDTIATRHDTNIKLWSISTNTCKGTINVAVKENMSVLDVNTLATLNSDNVVQVWNVSTQACMATIQPGRQINHMRKFSDTLVACFTGQWEVWSIKTQQVAGIISFFSAVPSSFGGYVAVSRQKEISVFKASTLECVKIFTTDHTASIRVVRMIDEGTVASGGDDGIKIWNIETQECTASLVGHSAPVRQIIMLDQITLVSSSTDEVVKFWNIQTQQCVNTVAIGHTYLTDIA